MPEYSPNDAVFEVVGGFVYVAVGDSNTQAVIEPRSYPTLVAERDGCFARTVNAGQGGLTILDISESQDSDIHQYNPDVVSMMYGTNDHSLPGGLDTPYVSLDTFRDTYRQIIESLVPQTKVILITPPFIADLRRSDGQWRFLNDRLKDYSTVVRDLAASLGTMLLDAHAITTELCGGNQEVWTTTFCRPSNGVHMNAATQQVLYEALHPLLSAALGDLGSPREHAMSEIEKNDTAFIKVLFTFPDATTARVSIPHFRPQDQADIEIGIRNRWVSEWRARSGQ